MEGKNMTGGKRKREKANREVSLTTTTKKKRMALALRGGSARGDGRVKLRSNKVQNQ